MHPDPVRDLAGDPATGPIGDEGSFMSAESEDPRSQRGYDIIRLHPSGRFYERAAEAPEMPLGQSRIGGPVIDLPEGFEPPADLFFVAQLDLAWLAPSAAREMWLPDDHGFLFFFYNL